MTKRRSAIVGDDVIQGLDNVLGYMKGDRRKVRAHVVEVPAVDVKALRAKLGLSQDRFAAAFGVSAKTLRKWEQGARRPSGAARILLRVIDRHPTVVLEALSA